MSPVTLYEEPNYGGRSLALDIGQRRFFTPDDFNDVASSIQVPAGLVAYLYEHADDFSPFGRAVDLMEDCPDLSVYGMAKQVSYVTVFASTDPRGFVWARATGSGDSFVAGHWERQRANGQLPANPGFGAVSPPIPSSSPAPTTVLEIQGATTVITTLGPQDFGQSSTWQHAVTDQLGVIGTDFRGAQEIGTAAIERASNNPVLPDSLNFWYPQQPAHDHRPPHKRTLVGSLREAHVAEISGTFKDNDLNIDVTPDPLYQYLITDGHPREYTDLMSLQWNLSLHQSGQSDCDSAESKDEFSFVEAEIQPASDVSSGVAEGLRDRIIAAADGKVAMYGPWIYDKGHCCHSEIHPAEQIWFRVAGGSDGPTYDLSVICDASERYWWRDQMDDGTKLRPWAAPPITGVFAVAFEVAPPSPVRQSPALVFDAAGVSADNVIASPAGNVAHELTYQGATLVRFNPNSDAFTVTFEQVGTEDNGNIRGFLVLETTVGVLTQKRIDAQYPAGTDVDAIDQGAERDVFAKEAGHHMFTVHQHLEEPVNAPVTAAVNTPVTAAVNAAVAAPGNPADVVVRDHRH